MSISGFFIYSLILSHYSLTHIFYLNNSVFSILSATDKKKIEKKTKKSFLIQNNDVDCITNHNETN